MGRALLVACSLSCLVGAYASAARHIASGAGAHCAAYEILYPTIFDQLMPFMSGITQSQVDLASKRLGWPGSAPKHAHLKYNETAAATMSPADPAYPWFATPSKPAAAVIPSMPILADRVVVVL